VAYIVRSLSAFQCSSTEPANLCISIIQLAIYLELFNALLIRKTFAMQETMQFRIPYRLTCQVI